MENSKPYIAIVGNPNCGKTTIFNQLTGLRQKVANYPGVTVERKEGTIVYDDGTEIQLLDLPGTYSLSAGSPDEKIVSDILFGKHESLQKPQSVLCIVDASNIERSLYLISQIIDQRYPVLLVLNMIDVAQSYGISIDVNKLEKRLGVKIIATNAKKGIGIEQLKDALRKEFKVSPAVRQWKLPSLVREEHDELTAMLVEHAKLPAEHAFHEATILLSTPRSLDTFRKDYNNIILDHVVQDYDRLKLHGYDRHSIFIQSRIEWIRTICNGIVYRSPKKDTTTDKIDKVVTHPVLGYVIFALIMASLFQAVFTWAAYPMELIELGVSWLAGFVSSMLPEGSLRDLVVDGAIIGGGAVIVFIPQIVLLFFFLGLLEDSGYLSRAAFLMDRVMSKVGLSGKAFIPLLSSFACAIPGIMATRTIENHRDRFVTIFVAPLLSCSARLPVYSLLIAALIPPVTVAGIFNLQGIVMVTLYLSGIVLALVIAFLLRKTIVKGKAKEFILELPPYRIPSFKNIFLQMWERSVVFIKRAGTIILFASIVIWYLASHPVIENAVSPSEQLSQSYLGKAGKAIEPVIEPLGFDWKIGVAILSSMLQRELFVSTIATLYNLEDNESLITGFQQSIANDINPSTGMPTFTILTALTILIYYVIALQCFSTIAIVRRETNSWKFALSQYIFLTVFSYIAALTVYRIGLFFY